MKKEIVNNPQLELARNFVQFTGKHIFLTGKAGTGKTTFLHQLKEESPKRMIVVAPTGVAAINAGGVTIHSFFQLPFGPFVPGAESRDQQKYRRFSREKRNIMKSLDLLVIDEVSMVRADLLDGIDETLRRFRRNQLPFGGVQLLMIGDMQQLAPVVRDEEWNMLSRYYKSMFFFSSNALQKTDFESIELLHVYRQSDRHFIELLNQVRDNKIDKHLIEELNKRYDPDFDTKDKGYITLTTHNAKAAQVNDSKLAQLKKKSVKFNAEIVGSFPEYTYPTDTILELKLGAQVMFVKNDPDPEKRYFNGKIGKVITLEEDDIVVECPGDDEPIHVVPVEWQNRKYSINQDTKEIEETVEGTFTQIPLKLAWAITIHKSQGLTFDKAVIDAEQAFAYGQVYVALSRCSSLEGLVLSSPFSPGALKSDHKIQDFNTEVEKNKPDIQKLEQAKLQFQEELLFDLFDFTQLQKEIYHFTRALLENEKSIQPGAVELFEKLPGSFKPEIVEVSQKFISQIKYYLNQNSNAEKNEKLQDRITKAVGYFEDKLENSLLSLLASFSVESDNKEIVRNIKNSQNSLLQEAKFKMACLQACNKRFVVKEFLMEKSKASIEGPSKTGDTKKSKPAVSSEVLNPELYEILKEWRNTKSAELRVPVFMVLPLKTMRALTNQLPSSEDELNGVHGFGKKKIETFGIEILDLLNAYREDHEVKVEKAVDVERPALKPKVNTREVSLKLWNKHREIAIVAVEREMAITTIEDHLAYYVGNGKLPVQDFVGDHKIDRISLFFERNSGIKLSEAKTRLGERFSYRELKFVQQHLQFKEIIPK